MKFNIKNINKLYSIENIKDKEENEQLEDIEKIDSPEDNEEFIKDMEKIENPKLTDDKEFWITTRLENMYDNIIDWFKNNPDAKNSWALEKLNKEYRKTNKELQLSKEAWLDLSRTPQAFNTFVWKLERKL